MDYTLTISTAEMEALQSIFATADLSKITEKSVPGLASLIAKVYAYKPQEGYTR